MPTTSILHVTPARSPQAFALPLPRRTWYAVETRRQDGTLPAPPWYLTARYSRRRHAEAHAALISRQDPRRYSVRIRKEVTP